MMTSYLRTLWRCLCCLALVGLLALAGGAGAAASDFPAPPIKAAELRVMNGMPLLHLNGKPTPPLVFFFNNEAAEGIRAQYLAPQVRQSAAAGVHIYSMVLPLPAGEGPVDLGATRAILEPFLAADPQALFIPRINIDAPPAWLAEHPQARIVTTDGPQAITSIASEEWVAYTKRTLDAFVAALESSPYGGRMIGYHLTGQTAGEWFPHLYRESGPDLGPANTAGFRAWLARRYHDDDGLRAAWPGTTATLATAGVPVPAAGRFPVHNIDEGIPFAAFYQLPAQAPWVDYSRYISELTASRLLDFAHLIKQRTERRRLTIFFYGYSQELPSSINGHGDLMALLDSPDIDMLASPVSYQERLLGDTTGFMSAVDTITAHGKLWMIENDMRTHLWAPAYQPAEIANSPAFQAELAFIPRSRDTTETVELLRRDYAAMLVHRTGTWWMDLAAVGNFRDQRFWDMVRENAGLYDALYQAPRPFQPEVAFILDEHARDFEQSDWDLYHETLIQTRHALGQSGASFGSYLMADFEAGRIPPCKAYVFANCFTLSPERVAVIQRRLEEQRATALWLYAPGWLNGRQTDLQQMRTLTGINLVQRDGKLGSAGEGAAQGLTWGYAKRGLDWAKSFEISPRFVAEDSAAETLGRYVTDGAPSLVVKPRGAATHVYAGDINLSVDVLRVILRRAGVHLWTTQPLAVQYDGSLLAVHVSEAGVYEIAVPAGVELHPRNVRVLGQRGATLFVSFGRAQTALFDVTPTQP